MQEKQEILRKSIAGMLKKIHNIQALERICRLAEYLYVYADQEHPAQQADTVKHECS